MRWYVALIMMLGVGIAEAALPPALAGLAAAERQFAADGAREGIQKSFLSRFAADAVVFKPFATPGIGWYRAHPDGPGKLVWAPQYLAISAAGDLGVSSGPWRFEAERGGKTVRAYGHFFSVWRHDPAHGWRVVLDHGIGYPAPRDAVEAAGLVALAPVAAGPRPAAAARRRALERLDDALRARLAAGAADAYARIARPDTLWLRDGAVPQQGPRPPPGATACGCGPRAGLTVAASGDIAYSFGGGDGARARARGIDVRVWRSDANGAWTLLADLAAAVD